MELFSLDHIYKNLRIVGEIYYNNEYNTLMFGCSHCKTSTGMSFFKSLSELCRHNLDILESDQSELNENPNENTHTKNTEGEKHQNHDSENQQSTQTLSKELEIKNETITASSGLWGAQMKISEITSFDETFKQNCTAEGKHINAGSSISCNQEENINLENFIDLTEDDETLYTDSGSKQSSLVEDFGPADYTYGTISGQNSFTSKSLFQKKNLKEIVVEPSKEYVNVESNLISSVVSRTNRIATDFPSIERGKTQNSLNYWKAQNVEHNPQLSVVSHTLSNNNDDNNNNTYKNDNDSYKFEEIERKLKEMHDQNEGWKFQNQNSLQENQENKYKLSFSAENSIKNLSNAENGILYPSNQLQLIGPPTIRNKIVPMVVIPNSRWSTNDDGDQLREVYKKRKINDEMIRS